MADLGQDLQLGARYGCGNRLYMGLPDLVRPPEKWSFLNYCLRAEEGH